MEAEIKLVVDASSCGLGCVLLQEVDNEMRLVAYTSRSLTDVEKRYAQIEREAFDHHILVNKLDRYAIRGPALE